MLQTALNLRIITEPTITVVNNDDLNVVTMSPILWPFFVAVIKWMQKAINMGTFAKCPTFDHVTVYVTQLQNRVVSSSGEVHCNFKQPLSQGPPVIWILALSRESNLIVVMAFFNSMALSIRKFLFSHKYQRNTHEYACRESSCNPRQLYYRESCSRIHPKNSKHLFLTRAREAEGINWADSSNTPPPPKYWLATAFCLQ